MKKLIKLEDAVGKTITGFREWNNDLLIVFEDSYSNYHASGYEGADFSLQEIDFNYGLEQKIGLELGLLSLEELTELENQAKIKEAERLVRIKSSRREEYEKLKKEFENEGKN